MSGSVDPAAGDQNGVAAPPGVSYRASGALWAGFDERVAAVIRESGAVAVGELGGGANPKVALEALVGRSLELTVLDVSQAELDRAPHGVEKVCVDLCADEPPVRDRFDLVFSRMLCEHVRSGEIFHRNCLAALRPGGYAVHFFPAATALPFVLNRLLPETLSQAVLERIFPARRRDGRHGKFPARYSWCWGPTRRQIGRFRGLGCEVLSWEAGIGHDYYSRIPVLRDLERAKTEAVLRRPRPWLAAYNVVVLRRTPLPTTVEP